MARSNGKLWAIGAIGLVAAFALGYWVILPMMGEPSSDVAFPVPGNANETSNSRTLPASHGGTASVNLTGGVSLDTTMQAAGIRGRSAQRLGSTTQHSGSVLDLVTGSAGSNPTSTESVIGPPLPLFEQYPSTRPIGDR